MDARLCVARVRNGRCPASALKYFVPGPLGDASGSVSLVVAYVSVSFIYDVIFMRLSLCGDDVK